MELVSSILPQVHKELHKMSSKVNKKTAAAISALIDGARWAGKRKEASLKDGSIYAFWDASLSEALCVIELADRFGIELTLLDVTRDQIDLFRAKEETHRPEELRA